MLKVWDNFQSVWTLGSRGQHEGTLKLKRMHRFASVLFLDNYEFTPIRLLILIITVFFSQKIEIE